MTDDRIRRADGLGANWPNLAAYIRQMAEPEGIALSELASRLGITEGAIVVTEEDGEYE